MKVTGIETVVVNAVHRNWIFVKVLTDQPGLWGWGEATLEWKTRAVKGTIEDLAPFVSEAEAGYFPSANGNASEGVRSLSRIPAISFTRPGYW